MGTVKSPKGGMNRSCLRVITSVIRKQDQGNLEEFRQAYGSRGLVYDGKAKAW